MASESSILSAVKSEQISNSQPLFFPLKQARSIKDAKSSIADITVNHSISKSARLRSKSAEKSSENQIEKLVEEQPETKNNEKSKKLKHKKQKTKHKKQHKTGHKTKEPKRTRKSSHTTANLTDVFTDIDSLHEYVPQTILPTSRVLSSLNPHRPISGTLRSGRNRSRPLTAASSFTMASENINLTTN